MENGSLICSASNHDRVLYRRIDSEVHLGLTEVGRYGRTAGQWKVQFTGFVKHPLGIVPIVGEVLVVKYWHRALALIENPDNLLVHPPARQEPVPLEIGWIIPVFSDDDNTIHRKFPPPKCDSLSHCLIDGNVFRFAYFLTQSACVKLMNVNGHNIHP